MIWILIAAWIAAIIFGVHLFRIKRQLHHIACQLNDRINGETEKKVTVSLLDSNLNELAASINRSLNLQEKLRIEVR